MSFIGDCYKQLSKQDFLRGAFRSAIAVFMLFVVTAVGGWQNHPDTFPQIDMAGLKTTLNLTFITFISSILGSYWSNSDGKLFKKDPPKVVEMKP